MNDNQPRWKLDRAGIALLGLVLILLGVLIYQRAEWAQQFHCRQAKYLQGVYSASSDKYFIMMPAVPLMVNGVYADINTMVVADNASVLRATTVYKYCSPSHNRAYFWLPSNLFDDGEVDVPRLVESGFTICNPDIECWPGETMKYIVFINDKVVKTGEVIRQ